MEIIYPLLETDISHVRVAFHDVRALDSYQEEAVKFALRDDAEQQIKCDEYLRSFAERLKNTERMCASMLIKYDEERFLSQREIADLSSPPSEAELQQEQYSLQADPDFKRLCMLQAGKSKRPSQEDIERAAAKVAVRSVIRARAFIGVPERIRESARNGETRVYKISPVDNRNIRCNAECLARLDRFEVARTEQNRSISVDNSRVIPMGFAEHLNMKECGALGYLRTRGDRQELFIIPMKLYQSVLRTYLKLSVEVIPAMRNWYAAHRAKIASATSSHVDAVADAIERAINT